MVEFLDIVKKDLLAPSGLTEHQLENVLHRLTGPSIDYADLFFQSNYSESYFLEDGIIKGGSFDIDQGVGLRTISGERTGFAYADDLTLSALYEAAHAAHSITHQRPAPKVQAFKYRKVPALYQPLNPLRCISDNEKISLLQEIDDYLRSKDHRIVQVSLNLSSEYELVFILTSEGELAGDVRPLVRFNVSVVIEDQGRREHGYSGGGGRTDYDPLIKKKLGFFYADEALRQALINLEAEDAPAGRMPVILGPGWPGVLLHEAVGHGLEGDFNRKGISIYSGRMGEKVASELCNVVDDGTMRNARGSINIDDEGTPGQKTLLIENGKLAGYMLDRRNARLMGLSSTGNGRRESYASLPIPRMTNTYLLPGQSKHEDIIASVKRGLYAVNFGGGQVDITSGKFVFSMNEAYLIEDGKISTPVKGATLIGNGPEILSQISMVGDNLKLDSGIGVCGKEGQSVPVGVGQPTVRVDQLTVGGTRAL